MMTPEAWAKRAVALASLRLADEALEAECDVAFFVAGGPGGQHRNKASTGVRLSHRPTGIVVTATERRSQMQNRGEALERLRRALSALTFVPKDRRATKPTRGSKERRLTAKKAHGQKKWDRGRGDW